MRDQTRRAFLLTTMASGVLDGAGDRYAAAQSSFNPEGKSILDSVITGKTYRGRIPSAEVSALMKAERLTRDALMLKLIPVAKSFAHAPLSNYFVGAVVLGRSSSLYLGCNIEIPGNMLGLAVHGEQAATANAYMSEETGIEAITVGGAPCGHCRQFLSETSLDLAMRVIMKDGSSVRLSELLPQAFGPRNLGFNQGSFPVKRARLSTTANSSDPLVREALNAACAAYTPYTRSPSGVSLLTSNGRVFSGSYIENAAFNPSLPPLETALAGYFAAGQKGGQIKRAVLLEKEKPGISHETTTRSALAVLAPSVRLETYLAVGE